MTEADSCLQQLIVLNYIAKRQLKLSFADCRSLPEQVMCLCYLNGETNSREIVFN